MVNKSNRVPLSFRQPHFFPPILAFAHRDRSNHFLFIYFTFKIKPKSIFSVDFCGSIIYLHLLSVTGDSGAAAADDEEDGASTDCAEIGALVFKIVIKLAISILVTM